MATSQWLPSKLHVATTQSFQCGVDRKGRKGGTSTKLYIRQYIVEIGSSDPRMPWCGDLIGFSHRPASLGIPGGPRSSWADGCLELMQSRSHSLRPRLAKDCHDPSAWYDAHLFAITTMTVGIVGHHTRWRRPAHHLQRKDHRASMFHF